MLSRGLLVSLVLSALAFTARAQYSEPVLVFLGDPGRPASGNVMATSSALGDDLFLAPVVAVPKLSDNGVFPWVIIEVPGGEPIMLPLTNFVGDLLPGHGSSGDLNGDGSDDFVTANGAGSVSLYTGVTGPDLTGPINTDIPGSQGPFRIVTLDLDASPRDDLAVGDHAGVRLLLNLGNGQFQDKTPGQVALPMDTLRDIATGNVNGDGMDDLVLVSGSGTSGLVQVFRQGGTSASGFTQVHSFSPGMAVASAKLVDFDGNGFDDLILALHEFTTAPPYRGYLNIYLNPGDGVFPPVANFSMQRQSTTGVLPTFGAAGDMDEDGDIDMVYSENDSIAYPPGTFAQYNPPVVLVWCKNFYGQGTPSVIFETRATRYVGKAVDPIIVDFPTDPGAAPGLTESSLAAADGDLDMALTWRSDQAAGTSSPDEDDPATYLGAWINGPAPFPVDPKPVQFATGLRPGDGDSGEVGDIVGGGSVEPGPGDSVSNGPDVVVPNLLSNSITVALGDGEGTFPMVFDIDDIATTAPPGYAGGPRTCLLDDLTGDGFDDCVTYSEFRISGDWASQLTQLVSDGTGELLKVQEIALDHAGEASLGDIDDDGFVDAVVTRRRGALAPHDIEIHFGDGSGELDLSASPVQVMLRNGAKLTGGIDIGDVDIDGDLDVASTYSKPAKFQQPGGGQPGGPGDGPLTQAGVVLFRNDWPSASTLVPIFTLFVTAGGTPDVESVVLGQVGGSAWPDVSVGHRTGAMWHGRGLGTGSFTPTAIDSESATVGGGSLALADIDDNGLLDIVSHKGELAKQAVVQVHKSDGSADFQVREIGGWCPADIDGGTRPVLADLNMNGQVDLCIAHPNDSVTVLLNDGFGLTESAGDPGPGAPGLRVGGLPFPGGTLRLRVAAAAGAMGAVIAGPPPAPGAPLSAGTLLVLLPFRADAAGEAELWLQLPADFEPALEALAVQVLVPGAGASSVLTLPLARS
jgi:FG-GAP-like repeat